MDGRLYPISKSQGISKMVSAFKDYSKRGLGLKLSSDKPIEVNTCRIGKFYRNNVTMLPLTESPGLRIIDPTKAGNGYWNFDRWLLKQKTSLQL